MALGRAKRFPPFPGPVEKLVVERRAPALPFTTALSPVFPVFPLPIGARWQGLIGVRPGLSAASANAAAARSDCRARFSAQPLRGSARQGSASGRREPARRRWPIRAAPTQRCGPGCPQVAGRGPPGCGLPGQGSALAIGRIRCRSVPGIQPGPPPLRSRPTDLNGCRILRWPGRSPRLSALCAACFPRSGGSRSAAAAYRDARDSPGCLPLWSG